MRLSIFSCVYWPFVCLLWKNVFSNSLFFNWMIWGFFCLFVFWVFFFFFFFLLLGCVSSLYILEINPLSIQMIWKYFLPFHSLLLHFLILLLWKSFCVWGSLSCLFLLLLLELLYQTPQKITGGFIHIFFWEFYSFRSQVKTFNLFQVDFCEWYKIEI